MKKICLIFSLSILIITVAIAQPRIAGQADIGGSDQDLLMTACRGTDGALLAAGYSNSNKSLYKSQDSKGDYDFWVVQSVRGKKGKIIKQWDKTIGSSGFDRLIAAAPADNGGYFLGGISYSGKSGDKSDDGSGIWIVKINSHGDILWDTTLASVPGKGNVNLYGMDSTTGGGVILTASYYNAASGYSAAIPVVIKLDANGNVILNKPVFILDSIQESYHSVKQTADGGFIFSGYDGGKLTLFKTDADINELWKTRFYRRTGFEVWFKARELKNGDYVLYGSFATSVWDDGSPEDYYTYLYKTDPAGKQLWSKEAYVSTTYRGIVAFEETSTGDYLIGRQIDYPVSNSPKSIIKKTDSDGNIIWTDTIDIYDASVLDLKELEPATYLYSMQTFAGITGEKTKPNIGEEDYWFLMVKDTAAENASMLTERMAAPSALQKGDLFTVYPNPARMQLHVQCTGKATFSLISQNGKTAIQQVIQNSGTINIQKLPAGVYYLKNNATGLAKKIMITK